MWYWLLVVPWLFLVVMFAVDRVVNPWSRAKAEKKYPPRTIAIGTRPSAADAYSALLSKTLTTYQKTMVNNIFSPTPVTLKYWPDLDEPAEPLEETWTPDKIVAWRAVTVESDDGLWLGHPHPDGPTMESKDHPVGVELHAECIDRKSNIPFGDPWGTGENSCAETPGENCKSGVGDGCGYYAFKTRDAAEKYRGKMAYGRNYSVAIAKVLLSGKVIEHDIGYRAEILEVTEIVEAPVEEPDDPMGVIISAAGVQAAAGDPTMALWLAQNLKRNI